MVIINYNTFVNDYEKCDLTRTGTDTWGVWGLHLKYLKDYSSTKYRYFSKITHSFIEFIVILHYNIIFCYVYFFKYLYDV